MTCPASTVITDDVELPDVRHLRTLTTRRFDVQAAEHAAAALVEALGVDLTDPSLAATPGRMVRAYVELLTPPEVSLTTFPNDAGYDELVLACDIPFTSICEHHLLAFTGTATVGYLPGARLLGLSKLARVVDLHARRPQIQERMTKQIADWLDERLEPRGVGVVVRAEHSCMTLRGARARGSSTVTSALLGLVRTDERTRNEFLTLSERQSQ
jgi:GTP cyclohydrolase IA